MSTKKGKTKPAVATKPASVAKTKAKAESKRVRKVVGLSEYHYAMLGMIAKKKDMSLQATHADIVEKALLARGCKPSPPKPPRKNAAKPKPPKTAKKVKDKAESAVEAKKTAPKKAESK